MCLAVPGGSSSIEERDDTLMAEVDFGGVRKEVCLAVRARHRRSANTSIVHVGFALQRLDEESALRDPGELRAAGHARRGVRRRVRAAPPSRPACREPDRREATAMKYLDEFSDPRPGRARCSTRSTRPTTRPLGDHGGLRRPDPLDHPARHRPAAARRDRADPRPRLPGLRDAAGDHRQGAGDRRAPGRDLLLVRRHAARARQRQGPVPGQERAAATSGSSTRRWTRSRSPRREPRPQVVFFGIGFETTAPANAMAVYQAQAARDRELHAAGLARPGAAGDRGDHGVAECRVQAFLAAGHVCSVMGTGRVPAAGRAVPACRSWSPASSRSTSSRASAAPCVQLEAGRHEVENAYPRAVPTRATRPRWRCCGTSSRSTDRAWRGIGDDPAERLAAVRALPRVRRRAPVRGDRHPHRRSRRSAGRGEVLQGLIKPHECAAFGTRVHAAQPARRHDGVQRGRLRRVLPVPPAGARRRRARG